MKTESIRQACIVGSHLEVIADAQRDLCCRRGETRGLLVNGAAQKHTSLDVVHVYFVCAFSAVTVHV